MHVEYDVKANEAPREDNINEKRDRDVFDTGKQICGALANLDFFLRAGVASETQTSTYIFCSTKL